MEARELCPPETISVINHYKKNLLAYTIIGNRKSSIKYQEEWKVIGSPKGKDFMAA